MLWCIVFGMFVSAKVCSGEVVLSGLNMRQEFQSVLVPCLFECAVIKVSCFTIVVCEGICLIG